MLRRRMKMFIAKKLPSRRSTLQSVSAIVGKETIGPLTSGFASGQYL